MRNSNPYLNAPGKFALAGLLSLAASTGLVACRTQNPADAFVEHMKSLPPDERPPDWEQTRRLMARRAPKVGEVAPDFTLDTFDGQRAVTRSRIQGDRPMVLIFGSYT